MTLEAARHAYLSDYVTQVSEAAGKLDVGAITDAVQLVDECLRVGGTVWLAGNGGSAAIASHVAVDLAHRVNGGRVVSLVDSPAMLTATANDRNYEEIFSRQLAGRVYPRDVLLLFSVSGESANVLRAAETGRKAGATVVAFTTGGNLATMADVVIRANVTPNKCEVAEDAMQIAAHAICWRLVREAREAQALDWPAFAYG